MSDEPTQLDKFKEAAREPETDDNPNRLQEWPAGLVKYNPVEMKPE